MGGQLGSCFLCFGIVQQHRKNIPPKDLRFLGGPRRREDKGGAPTREFGPILPSDEADMCRFSGLKVFSEENLVKYRARNFETKS